MLPEQDFITKQYDFARYIRDPQENSCPPDIEPRRMNVYAELFYNNIAGLLSSNFSVFCTMIDEQDWHDLIRAFMREHHCQSPIFVEIGKEFIQFLQNDVFQQQDLYLKLPDFTLELLWYEYLELMLEIDTARIDWSVFDAEQNILSGCPKVSPLTQLGQFSYPVHTICSTNKAADILKQDTFILIYRDRQHQLHFIQLSLLANLLFQELANNEGLTVVEILSHLSEQVNYPDHESFLVAGCELLNTWLIKDIIYLDATK